MPPPKLIGGFLGRFILVYALLIVPWPGLTAAYGAYFRALGRTVFAHESGRRDVTVEANPDHARFDLDTLFNLANRDQVDASGNVPVRRLGLDSRGVGWVPTALIIALALATPGSGRRRLGIFAACLLCIHCYILFSVAVYIWNNTDAASGLDLVTLNPFWKQVMNGLEETLITQMGPAFVLPVVLWALIAFRRQDYAALLAPRNRRPAS